ncbi:MAG: 6-bladed beta-propeller [Tannerellaceae bacterium]
MKKSLLFMLASGLLMMSCRNTQKEHQPSTITVDLTSELKYPFDGMIDSMYLVPLETTDDALLSHRNNIVLNDSLILCHSDFSKQIAVFYRDGKHRNTISRFGQGGEEYISISSYFLRGDTVVVNELSRKRLIYYSLDGDFIQAKNLPNKYSEVYPYDQNGNYIARSGISSSSYPTRLVLLGPDLDEKKELFNYALKDECKGFALFSPLSYQQDSWCFTANFSDKIYAVNEDSCSVKYEFDFGKWSLQKNQNMDDLSSFFKAIDNRSASKYIIGLDCIMEHGDWLYVATIETFSADAFFVNLKTGIAYPKNCDGIGAISILERKLVRDGDYLVGVMNPSRIQYVQGAFDRKFDGFNREPDAFEQKIVDLEIDEEANPVLCFFKLK